ncbi:cobalt-precorrin-7 (C(5))-methyltransferase [Methanobrevibacter sp. DSM 116169]|uniref:cobalt-precorrin-7 (C(5))-methyltransferase n=1 Tax=Methanobrevibacter sp. DSM 116169 TaxID=3242727 RepID=UPI0038FC40FE
MLYIVGIGPGSKEYLTQKAMAIVKQAEITVGSKRAIDLFDEINEKIIFNVKDLDEKLEASVNLAKSGKDIAILSTGDPGFSGVLKPIKRIAKSKDFSEDNIKVIPGISSLQLAASENKISWDDANIMTFHGRENIEDILDVINNGKKTIALPSRKVKDMAQFLIDNGIDKNRKAIVCERLSYPDEKIVENTLEEISKSEFTYMCVMVIHEI